MIFANRLYRSLAICKLYKYCSQGSKESLVLFYTYLFISYSVPDAFSPQLMTAYLIMSPS